MRTVIVPTLMRTVSVIAALLVLAAAAGCGSSGSDDGRTDVVAAFYPLAFAAERIGGDRVSVTNLTPPGAEPHDVELTPQDVAHIQKADVVLYLSHGFQPAVEKALGDARGEAFDALADIDLRNGVGDEAGESDPHVWLDPALFARVVRRLGDTLGSAEAADELAGEIERLDGEYRSGLANCARREFVTSHAAFGYLAARYKLRQIAITGIDPEAEPSAQSLASLAKLIRRDHVTTVFFETLISPKLAETVAREAGAKTAVLNPIEGLTPDEEQAGETYLSLMRQNLTALRKALDCR
jgi:zinc transport system substrate-binding protein